MKNCLITNNGKKLVIACIFVLGLSSLMAQTTTERVYLSGTGRDDSVTWDFFCTGGRGSGTWTKIPVPSNWETQGFGTYNYGEDYYEDEEYWTAKHRKRGRRKKKFRGTETGQYKREFNVSEKWKGKRIHLVFEGVMTDTAVRINGKSAGPVHQGGFYRFHYDITKLVKAGTNLLEVDVSKISGNIRLEHAERYADYWVFGGIYRPVYLNVLPMEFIDSSGVDAKANGEFVLDVYPKEITSADQVKAQIIDADGTPLGMMMAGRVNRAEKVRLTTMVSGHKLWTAETPNLYSVKIDLLKGQQVVHTVTRRFGFRTIEWRPEGLFVNGSRILIKGVNRHCFRPDSGRCLSRQDSYDDVELIKSMNMNAVRMSHYPPDKHFLEACDELGLWVLNEMAGWQRPSYDTPTARRLVKQLIQRDQMHPCIFLWANGNEGGWNAEIDSDFKALDVQKRRVVHPDAMNDGINTKHYPPYDRMVELCSGSAPYLPTEFLHGLNDGGHGSGLNTYWKVAKQGTSSCGGFLWVLADEGLVRADRGGAIDTDGHHAPDGIVGPYHEKEGSYYTIKEIWSPVQIQADIQADTFNGKLAVENAYDVRNLSTCTFNWQLIRVNEAKEIVVKKGRVKGPNLAPHKKGTLDLGNLTVKGMDILRLTAIDADGREIFTWSWDIGFGKATLPVKVDAPAPLKVTRTDETIVVSIKDASVVFDQSTGLLSTLTKGKLAIPLTNGPRIVHARAASSKANVIIAELGERVELTVANPGHGLEDLKWMVSNRGVVTMDCSYICNGDVDFHGVIFDLPEKAVTHKRWLGNGPYRVWKNRMRGPQFGIWENDYNDAITGQVWTYPEFKGYFSDVRWIALKMNNGSLIASPNQDNLFVRIFDPKGTPNVATFKGGLSFLHAIPAIGTKIKKPNMLGPSSQKTTASGKYRISVNFMIQ